MQEKPNNPYKKTLDKFKNDSIKEYSHIIIYLIMFSIFVLVLITIIPFVFVNGLMYFYNNTAETNMHISASSSFTNILIAFITLLYVVLTYELVSENRKMRKLQTEPNVYLFIETREKDYDIIDFFIQNIGMGAAYNIEFEVLSDYIYGLLTIDKEGHGLLIPKNLYASKASIIKNGIKYLAPNQKKRLFSTMLTQVKECNLQNNLDNHLQIRIRYEDKVEVEKEQEFTLCLYEVSANAIGQIDTFERKFLDELEEINKKMGEISQNIEKMGEKLYRENINEN